MNLPTNSSGFIILCVYTLLCLLVLVLEVRLPGQIHSSKLLCTLEYYASTSIAVRYGILNLVLIASSMEIQHVLLHSCTAVGQLHVCTLVVILEYTQL